MGEIPQTVRLSDFHRAELRREKIRSQGRILVFSAIVDGYDVGDMEPVLDFYRENAAVFLPPTEERAERIFHKDIAVARRYDEGVSTKVTKPETGKSTTEVLYLGDLVAETRGRIMEIDAQLKGKPIPRPK